MQIENGEMKMQENQFSNITSPQLKEREAAKILNVSTDKLRHDRMHRRGAPFRKYGAAVRYDLQELQEWMRQQSTEVQ